MKAVAFVVGLMISGAAFADDWIPYTDGRVGGCFIGNGNLYGCTPQPSPPAPTAPQPDLRQRRDSSIDGRNPLDVMNQVANEAVIEQQRTRDASQTMSDMNEAKKRSESAAKAAADQQKENEYRAWLQTAEGQKFLKTQTEQRQAELGQEQEIHKMFQQDTDLKTCAKREGTVNCSNAGCFCENGKVH